MLDYLDNNVDYLERIGVKIGPDRTVPKKHGVPRIFILKKDAQGVNDMKSLAASIVRREGLAKMDIGDLNKALVMNKDKYMDSNLIFKGEEAIYGTRLSQKQGQDKQKEVEADPYEALNTGVNYGYKAPKF